MLQATTYPHMLWNLLLGVQNYRLAQKIYVYCPRRLFVLMFGKCAEVGICIPPGLLRVAWIGSTCEAAPIPALAAGSKEATALENCDDYSS